MIGTLASALLMIPVGYLADKIGKKNVVVAGCYLLSLSELLFAFTNSWIEVIPVLFLYNAAFCYRPVMSALIADSLVRKKRATGFATFETIPRVAVVFASGLGGFLSEVWGFQRLFMLAAALSFIMAAIRHLSLREPKSGFETTFQSPVTALTYIARAPKSLRAFFAMTCIGPFFGAMIFPGFYSLYARTMLHMSRTQIGFAYAISLAFSSFFILPGGKLADHYGRKKFLVLSGIVNPLLLLAYVFAPNVSAVYLISGVSGSMEGLSMPAFQALQADLMPRGRRGTLMGFFSATRSIVSVPSPMISGYLWETYEPKAPFYLFISSQAVTLSILLLFVKETLTSEEK
jgi:MFS family permease